jgi:hypothetical protein
LYRNRSQTPAMALPISFDATQGFTPAVDESGDYIFSSGADRSLLYAGADDQSGADVDGDL